LASRGRSCRRPRSPSASTAWWAFGTDDRVSLPGLRSRGHELRPPCVRSRRFANRSDRAYGRSTALPTWCAKDGLRDRMRRAGLFACPVAERGAEAVQRAAVPEQRPPDVGQSRRVYRLAGACGGWEHQPAGLCRLRAASSSAPGPEPVLEPQPLPVRRRLDPLARGAERRHPRRPHRCRRVATPARHLTIGERCRTRIGKPDVRIPTEPDVATVAVDGKPLHPVAAPAAGLHDEEERSAVTVTSRPQGRSLLGPESSCHRGRPRISPHEYATLGAGTGGPTTARPGPYTASGSQTTQQNRRSSVLRGPPRTPIHALAARTRRARWTRLVVASRGSDRPAASCPSSRRPFRPEPR